jgi:hypothetical protein
MSKFPKFSSLGYAQNLKHLLDVIWKFFSLNFHFRQKLLLLVDADLWIFTTAPYQKRVSGINLAQTDCPPSGEKLILIECISVVGGSNV